MSTDPSAPLARAAPEAPDGWSEPELATLAELAETFVRGGATRRARLLAQAIDRLDPSQIRQLRLVLRLVESRPAAEPAAGRSLEHVPRPRERATEERPWPAGAARASPSDGPPTGG
jgi:hypothetical protein